MTIRFILTLLIFLVFYTICNGQSKYFEPKGIIDKTEEYLSKKIQWINLNDKEKVDGYTRIGDSIFGGEIACNIEPLDGIDIETFQVLAGTSYARDKNYVYYPLKRLCIDYTDCGVCYYSEVIIEKADPKSFIYLGKEYASDSKKAYFRGELIKFADGETFEIIDGPELFYFAVDKNHVYQHNQIFKQADPASFYYDKEDYRNENIINKYIIGDKDNEWEYIPPYLIKKVEKK